MQEKTYLSWVEEGLSGLPPPIEQPCAELRKKEYINILLYIKYLILTFFLQTTDNNIKNLNECEDEPRKQL